MLDLEKFGVLEMNAQEQKEVEGGFWITLLVIIVGLLIGIELAKL